MEGTETDFTHRIHIDQQRAVKQQNIELWVEEEASGIGSESETIRRSGNG